MATPAGWYDDGSGTKRYWDGAAWTQQTSQQAPPPYGPPPRKRRRAWRSGKAYFGGAVVAIVVAILVAVGWSVWPANSGGSAAVTLHGTLVQKDSPCLATPGGDQVGVGTGYRVLDATGTIDGVGTLADGTHYLYPDGVGGGSYCVYAISINLDHKSNAYQFVLGALPPLLFQDPSALVLATEGWNPGPFNWIPESQLDPSVVAELPGG